MNRSTKLLIDLPPDILFRIFGECDIPDVLNFSSTCKHLQSVADEHQVWLCQAIRLHIPIPVGTAPSKAELKDWVISRARVDFCWIKSRPGMLELHSFGTGSEFVGAHFIPGGKFVVLLYATGDVSLNKIGRSEVTGEWDFREVTRYKELEEGHSGRFCGRLLMETSYGSPVFVRAGSAANGRNTWEDPLVFLIDPILQVIEKKRYRYRDFDSFQVNSICEILAIRDRMFFICESTTTGSTALVSEIGPDLVTRRFTLHIPSDSDPGELEDDGYTDVVYFLVSENVLIASNEFGIYLYHIPELKAIGNDSDLVAISPQWSWLGRALECRGTLYKTACPHPALWLQGDRATHTLEFDIDGSGYFPVVVNHRIIDGKPAYDTSCWLKLQGRKGITVRLGLRWEIVINTAALGKPGITRRLCAVLPRFDDYHWRRREEVKYVDLDEATGRIMIVAGPIPLGFRRLTNKTLYARRLYLADLPM